MGSVAAANVDPALAATALERDALAALCAEEGRSINPNRGITCPTCGKLGHVAGCVQTAAQRELMKQNTRRRKGVSPGTLQHIRDSLELARKKADSKTVER